MALRLPAPVGYLIVAAAAAVPAAVALDPALDVDTWWHLRVGELIDRTGEVPRYDPFSRLGREQQTPWVAYSWLFEWGLYRVESRFGAAGVLWARTLLAGGSAAVVLAVLLRRRAVTPVALLAAWLTAFTLVPLARERPWHVTIAYTALVTALTSDLRSGTPTRRGLWLLLLFAVWANLHIQFVLGWLVLGLACVFPGRADRRSLVLLTFGCVAAVLANPYHTRLFAVVWEYATQTGPLRTVQELAPPDPLELWTWAGLALVGWAAVAAVRRRPVDGFELGMVAAALALSLRMRRDVWVTGVAAGTVLRDTGVEPPSNFRGRRVAAVVLGTFVVVRLVVPIDPQVQATADEARYPVRAAAFVHDHQPPGPLFNPFDWGGYLIHALPNHPVSADGRTNLYGSERLLRTMATWRAEPGWDADPDLAAANLVIAPTRGPLAQRLREAGWHVAHEDATAVVLTRTRGGGPPRRRSRAG